MNGKRIFGSVIILFGFISFIGAFAANKMANVNRGAKTKIITSDGTLISEGVLGYNKEGVETSEFLLWVFIIFGILLVIAGIALMVSASNEIKASYPTDDNMYLQRPRENEKWICTKCKQVNSHLVTKCIACGESMYNGAEIKRFSTMQAGANEWKCPNCGWVNQNYVGTCGCGTRKP